MKGYKWLAVLLGALVMLGIFAMALSAAPGPHRAIVVFEDDVDSAAGQALIEHARGVVIKDLDLINGKVVFMPSRAAASVLARKPGVRLVEEDKQVYALMARGGNGGGGGGGKPPQEDPPPPPDQPAQVTPWGVARIDATSTWPSFPTTQSVKVAVLDTGVQGDHPDLKDNYKGGYNAVNPRKQPKDDYGHGTHVAGTIAAYNNEIGVVGVAPDVELYAVKVLGKSGMLWYSNISDGLGWAVNNDIDVVNISLGWSADSPTVKQAIKNAADAGVIIVVAAGNDGTSTVSTVNYPAKYPEVIAVSATDASDTIAHWSSAGPEVDLAAPGVNILSTMPTYEVTLNNVYGYKQNYDYLSGTSMAAPHVAGSAALVMGILGLDRSPESAATVRKQLAKAEDLGDPGPDEKFGLGLVDAAAASTTSTP